MRNIVADLPPVLAQFYNSVEARTCDKCGTIHPGKGSSVTVIDAHSH